MAATDSQPSRTGAGAGGLVAAALLLPGLMPAFLPAAHADSPPEHNEVAVKFLSYQDSQPGLKRITVNSPSASVLAKVGEQWSMSATGTLDAISGASPRYHTAVSGASRMHDERAALDLKATRYFPRAAVTLGGNVSNEHDYRSTGLTALGKLSTEDNNRTWTAGLSWSGDRINPTNHAVTGERKRTLSLLGGVTQVLTANDIVQLNLGYTTGRGYYSDPYKFPDNRPRQRDQRTLYVAWNHYVEPLAAALRTNYRLYSDTWGVQSHTVGLEWQQSLGHGLSLTPSLRYTTQRAARFYYAPVYDPTLGAPFPVGYVIGSGAELSADQRLSAFGAFTGGLKLDWQISPMLMVDVGLDRYEQRGAWRVGGAGSQGLANFTAYMLQTGLTWRF